MKKSLEKLVNVIPDIIKNASGWFLTNLEDNGQSIIDNSSGTIGILLKLFGKPVVDKYYENRTKKKLENFGTETYLEAARYQVADSLHLIQDEIYASSETIIEKYNLIECEKISTTTAENLLFVFQPQYHPSIEFIKENQIRLLRELGVSISSIDTFRKDFNKNISRKVEETFGKEDYAIHLNEVEEFLLSESEINLLMEEIEASKIGFDANENLLYVETYGEWKSDFSDYQTTEKSTEKNAEKQLSLVEKLIDNYFDDSESIEKILFLIADFGKGKSVFMRHYAAKLAKEYIKTGEGYFPVYFNLREYNNYKSDEKLGVIANYLNKKYGFDIDQKKTYRFFFLIDSLDESGELTQYAIDNVIHSIKKIQNLDATKCRNNRIVIASRPIEVGLSSHIDKHNPFCIKNKEGREIPHFISIYGFKKEQFNSWLNHTLKNTEREPKELDTPLIKSILDGILNNKPIDIYKELLKEKSLSESELQRPIFAYMIYQLIIKNIDFLRMGQIGIYLSFINFLSRDAKYINDKSIKIDLIKEFEFRNLLHATSALWQFERHRGKQGFLNKADICRVLDGENKGESDSEILNKYKDVSDVQFLSHSYFGENDNTLHFQHQSFAEILLSEYYLKVFIRYAFDEDSNIYNCREKLLLGNPTKQTKLFFRDLLILLRETVSENLNEEVIEKRKLLFPLFASLAVKGNNNLFCQQLYFRWFDKNVIKNSETEYPIELLNNWCVNQEMLNRVIQLAAEIFNSKDTYLLSKSEPRINLFEKELSLIRNNSLTDTSNYFDKGLALLVGNTLCNDLSDKHNPILFNKSHNINSNFIIDFINKGHNNWDMFDMYKGINTKEKEKNIDFETFVLSGIDLSYSYFSNIGFNCTLDMVNFSNSVFNQIEFIGEAYNIDFENSTLTKCEFWGNIYNTDFSNCSFIEDFYFSGYYNNIYIHDFEIFTKKKVDEIISFHGKLFIPQTLKSLNGKNGKKEDRERQQKTDVRNLNQIISFVKIFGKELLQKRDNSKTIRNIFIFQNEFVERVFFRALLDKKTIEQAIELEKS